MIQYLLIENDDGTMTVVKIANERQVSSYRIQMNTEQLDHLLETFVMQIPNSYGMQRAFGEEKE
jgi:hypothetical protein